MVDRNNRRLATAATLVATFLTAMDTNVVSTAMPTIVGLLGGLSLYSWVFSIYLLATTVTAPIYGKFADLYGRKPVFAAGASLFLLGSLLCAAAQTMEQLILFRAIQGLGAGAVLPIAMTIVGDLYTLEERAKITALFSGMWGLASLAGPAVGGVLTDYVSWRWTFLINLPIGIAAIAMLWLTLREQVEHRRHQIDYLGAGLLAIGIGALMLGLLEGGRALPWDSWALRGLFITAAAAVVVFLLVEIRAAEPIIPLSLYRNRIIAASSALGATIGVVTFGTHNYIPPFIQGVLGGSAVVAGLAGIVVSIAWMGGSTSGGQLVLRFGFRITAVIGAIGVLAGSMLLVRLAADPSLTTIWLAMTVQGLGLGLASVTVVLAVQNAVPWNLRGVATSTNQFFRTIGGTLGLSVIGAVFNHRLLEELRLVPGSPGVDVANSLMTSEGRRSLQGIDLAAVQRPLELALIDVYVVSAFVSALAILAALTLPGGKPEQHSWERQEAKEEAPATSG